MRDKIDLTITAGISIREAMQRLDQTAEKCLFVVDTTKALIGALTDGDVRRAILSGKSLNASIAEFYNANPLYVQGSSDDKDDDLRRRAIELLPQHQIEVIPVVDDELRILTYYTWASLFDRPVGRRGDNINVPVVIMAGGTGTRLEPFTKVLPKPLIPVHDKPIIEHIIDRFVDRGSREFWITVNYKSKIMKSYFEDLEPDYHVNFVDEPEPLGTAGSLRFLRGELRAPFFVTNCDIIVDTNYHSILDFHSKHSHSITLVGSAVHHQIPYGTCVLTDSGALSRIDEKPGYDLLVNTGMYAVESDALNLIPDTGVFHMTDLINAVLDSGRTVGVYPVGEKAWIDVGQWKEYQQASALL